ncbi:MAG TPA: hypothetical protein VF316_25680 [Polyangiaceae bacterium]
MRSNVVKVSLFGTALLVLSACGLVLGLPGSDQVDTNFPPDGSSDSVVSGDVVKPDGGGADGPVGSDATPDAPCGADLTTDKANCGACGHSCLGGECVASKCQPVLLLDDNTLGPSGLAVDDTYVFYTDPYNSNVGRVPKLAKVPPDAPVIVAPAGTNTYYDPWRVATDGTYFYFNDTGNLASAPLPAVYQCPVSGCGVTNQLRKTLFSGANEDIGDVLVVNKVLYFTSAVAGTGKVRKCDVPDCNGGAVLVIDNQDIPDLLATDGTALYWGVENSGVVRTCALTGTCTPTVAVTLANPYGVAAAAGNVFAISFSFAGAIVKGPATTVVSNQTWPYNVVADASFVYWTNRTDNAAPGGAGNGRVMRCAVGGCANAPDELAKLTTSVRGLTQDATALYFANYGGGRIWKLAK